MFTHNLCSVFHFIFIGTCVAVQCLFSLVSISWYKLVNRKWCNHTWFNSDGTVNGWGWRFTVYPILPNGVQSSSSGGGISGGYNSGEGSTSSNLEGRRGRSDRSILSRPSIDLVMWLLDISLASIGAAAATFVGLCGGSGHIGSRLAGMITKPFTSGTTDNHGVVAWLIIGALGFVLKKKE